MKTDFNLNFTPKWFSATSLSQEIWRGPFKTMEEAYMEYGEKDGRRIYLAQGRRLKMQPDADEIDLWSIDTGNALEIRKAKLNLYGSWVDKT